MNTPETDAAVFRDMQNREVVVADLARRLERQRDEAIKDRDDWKAKHWKAHDDYQRLFADVPGFIERAEKAEQEVDRLKLCGIKNSKLLSTANEQCAIISDVKQRAEKAEAELAKAQEQVIEWQAKNLLLRQELAAAREALTQWLRHRIA